MALTRRCRQGRWPLSTGGARIPGAPPRECASAAEQERLLPGELLVGENALFVQLAELGQLGDRVVGRAGRDRGRWRGRIRRCRRGLRLELPDACLLVGLLLLRTRPRLARHVGGAADGGRAQQRTAAHQRHRYSPSPGSARPIASMSSGAAATTRGPPTCGATARSTPSRSSGVTPSASAFVTCQAYDAGGASRAISAAILTRANVRGSSPV